MAFNPADWEDVPAAAPAGGGIDPSQWDDVDQAPKKEPSWFEAAARAVGQGLTMGFADELAGGAEALLTDKTYKQARDESRANFKAAEEAHPITSTVGKVAGGIGGAILAPGAGIARAVGVGAKLATGAGLGANIARGFAAGAITGAGESEKEDFADIARDAGRSGVVGGALGGVAGKLLHGKVSGAAKRVDQRTISDIGMQSTPTTWKKLAQNAENVLGAARKHGLEKVARDPEKLLPQAQAAKRATGQAIGKVYEAADAKIAGVPAEQVIAALQTVEKKYRGNPSQAMQGAADKVAKQIDTLRAQWSSRGAVPAAEVNAFKSSLQEGAFRGADVAPKVAIRAERDAAGAVRKVLETHVAGVLGPKKLEGLRGLNRDFGALVEVSKAAAERASRGAFPATGIRQIAGQGLETGALIGSLASGSALPYLGVKVGLPAAAAVNRAADVALAKLVKAAQAGSGTAEAAKRALEAGVPRGLVERFSTLALTEDEEPTPEE